MDLLQDAPVRAMVKRCAVTRRAAPAALFLLALLPALAAGQAVSLTELRPFVVGVIPVVGPGGAVGGVSVDAQGIVSRSDIDSAGRLREARLQAQARIEAPLEAASPMRKISLRGLAAALDQRRVKRLPLTDELQNLAGVQRIDYVLVYPERHDIVLAGPAEGWTIDEQGNAVGRSTRQPVLQLDDLIVALRTAREAAAGSGITCSIDPTEEGLERFGRLLKGRGLEMNEATVARLEQTLGPQQVTVTGVAKGSHFAHVLVAADFLMKRLAMNLEPAPIEGMPSYLQSIQARGAAPRSSMPRFWLAPHYEPLLKDETGLAWQLRRPQEGWGGVQALTEDGYLSAGGALVDRRGKEEPLAKKWVENMTARYGELSAAAPVFGKLRGCIDLAVVAALLAKEDLPGLAGCDLSLLLDEKQIAVAEYHVPKSIASQASLIRKGRGWIVGISGGVDVNSWAVLEQVELEPALAAQRKAAAASDDAAWWWD